MTIEHAMDDGKRIDDQSSRWIFDLGKLFSSLLPFVSQKKGEREREIKSGEKKTRFANHNSYSPLFCQSVFSLVFPMFVYTYACILKPR